MRKIIGTFLVMILCVSLLGCGSGKSEVGEDVTDSNKTSTKASIKTEASTTTEEPTTTETPITDVTAITIKGDNSVQLGQTLNLSVEFTPSDTTDKSITWSSSDSNILTVDEEGVITGVNIGVATITATSSIPEIIDAIEMTFKVKVSISGTPDSKRYNFNFLKSDSPADVIKVLELLTGQDCSLVSGKN